jgi:AcrR family transcriptional regulator
MEATLSRKDRERKNREELFLDTAGEMLLKEGYLGLNLDRLAYKVEYSKGTLYQHFKTKEDLILAIAARSLAQRHELFTRAATLTGRPRERISAITIADLVFVHVHPQHFQIEQLMRQASLWEKTSDERRKQFGLNTEGCVGTVSRIVNDAISQGDLKLSSMNLTEAILGLRALSLGSHLLAQQPQLMKEIGIEKPARALVLQQMAYLDGLGWKPLSTEWDYKATYDRIFKDIFPEVKRDELGI